MQKTGISYRDVMLEAEKRCFITRGSTLYSLWHTVLDSLIIGSLAKKIWANLQISHLVRLHLPIRIHNRHRIEFDLQSAV